MDHDHAGGGGEQAAHHYHLADTDAAAATASEEVVGGGGGGDWPRALLRRGWELAGKLAIAGAAAATAAPVVAPPIMLLSAAGLALSVPFAAYLATLAATHRLMAALLPPHPPHESGRDVAVEQELLDAFYHLSTTDHRDRVIREEFASPPPPLVDELVSFQESSVPRNGEKMEDATSTTREEKEYSTKDTLPMTTGVSEFLVPVVDTREEDGVSVQQLGQHHTHVLDIGDKTEESNVSGTPFPIFSDRDNVIKGDQVEGIVVVEAAVVEQLASNSGIVARELVDTNVGIVAIAAPENEATPLTSTSYDGEMQETAAMDDTMRDLSDANIEEDALRHDQGVVCTSVSVASPLAVRDYDQDVMSSGSTQDIPDICDEISQPGQEHDQSDGFEGEVISGDKGLYTEEHVRQQLETLRTITGYRSPFSSTLEGELAGLYLFVGVEPPVSSRNASDLMEINAKLRLLKSIIGVD
uniref:Uncharacterized protein n=1 Tax=Oryza punctata TaxID=4537 RepID=A0A0E0MMS6_ORYPU